MILRDRTARVRILSILIYRYAVLYCFYYKYYITTTCKKVA